MNTQRMSCGETREKLPLYVGGDLDSEILEAVRAHLDLCNECSRRAGEALRARRELVGALRSRESDRPRPDLWPALRATLRAEGLVHEPRAPLALPAAPARVPSRRWTWALAVSAAAALLLAVAQISGVLAPRGQGERMPELVDATPMGGGGVGRADVPVVPVGLPASGGLQRIDPREPIRRPAVFRPVRQGLSAEPSPNDISLTGLNGFK